MANEGPLSYFLADAPADSPLSYQSLLARRKIAEALLGRRSPFPKTIGEGLTYFGEKVGNQRLLDQLDAAEGARQAQIDKVESEAPAADEVAAPAAAPIAKAAPIPAKAVSAPAVPIPDDEASDEATALRSYGTRSPYAPAAAPVDDMPDTSPNAGGAFGGAFRGTGGPRSDAGPLQDPRNSVARAVLAQRGVIPPGPALAALPGGDTASDAPPIGVPGVQLAQAGKTPTVVPDIRPMVEAPGAPSIPALPQNMPPDFKMSEPTSPPVPTERPKSARELYGERIYMQGVKTGDTQMQQLGQTIIAPLKAARDHLYARDVEAYKAGMSHFTALQTLYLKQQMEERDKALLTNKNAQELAALPEELRQKALKGQLEITAKIRDLEGEGFFPLSPEESVAFKPAEGQIMYKNRRGELKFGPRPPGATTVNIDQKATEKGMEAIETAMGHHVVEQYKEGSAAGDDLQTLAQMRALAARVETGPVAVAKQFAGRFGIKTEGVSDVEALNAMINRVVPQQRIPGSGATSDFDARMFQASVPQLMNTPQGNQIIMDTMEGIARNKIARSEIAGKVISRQLTIAQSIPEFMKLQQEAKSISDRVRLYLESTGAKLPDSVVPSQQQTDDAARQWLRNNPRDPRADAIRRRLEGGR
jgi:hypothetical protein